MNKKDFVKNYDFSEERLRCAFIELLDNVGDCLDEYELISEVANSIIDFYYYDLGIWAVENYKYIEDSVKEYGIDERDFDYHKMIQSAQYYKFNKELSNAYNTYKREVENGN